VTLDRDQHQLLIDLTWRYAVLVGITTPDGIFADEIVRADRKKWSRLIRRSGFGRPLFDDEDALLFMQEESGMPYKDCADVLSEEWPQTDEGPPSEAVKLS
jgi:hypothetical protein